MNSNWFKIVLIINGVIFRDRLVLKGVPIIYRRSGSIISIGSNVIIKSSFISNLVGLYSRTIIVTRESGAKIVIGDNVGISGATLYARKGIYIGNNTLIGGNCKILDNDFHPVDLVDRMLQQNGKKGVNADELIPKKEIIIGENCFIGCNTIILKGTFLGDGCVVGAGAVVSGQFDDNCLIGGNPARLIRYLSGNEEK